jgi:hypothetical protein
VRQVFSQNFKQEKEEEKKSTMGLELILHVHFTPGMAGCFTAHRLQRAFHIIWSGRRDMAY